MSSLEVILFINALGLSDLDVFNLPRASIIGSSRIVLDWSLIPLGEALSSGYLCSGDLLSAFSIKKSRGH